MAVTASIFLSPVFICVIEVFPLAQTIIKIKYHIGKCGSMIYRLYDTCITHLHKKMILQKNKYVLSVYYCK